MSEAGRIKIEMNADGTQSFVAPDGGILGTFAPGETGAGNADISPAMALLNELQKEDAAPIIRVLVVDGKKYPVRRLCWGGVNRFGMLTPRNEKGELDLASEEDGTSVMAAALLVGVATSKTDPTPYFRNWQEAHSFARDTSPKVIRVLGDIFQAFLAQNPSILPDAKREPVTWDDEELVGKKESS